MKIIALTLFVGIVNFGLCQSLEIGTGEQPQLTADARGVLRLVYGQGSKIFYSVSTDDGASFSAPTTIAEVGEMHLGMTRGPQLASSKDYSVLTAMDKKGNIQCFRLDHKTNVWSKIKNVNDVEGSAPEGLMGLACDGSNHFYAVWLDARDDKHNKIVFSMLAANGGWSRNRVVYKSPDGHVCECCKPSVAVRGHIVSLMFRNWIGGSRDLYLITSQDGGVNFGPPAKLGQGTWKLSGCPMDGGGIAIDKTNVVHTLWQRDGVVYYDQPGESETRIAEGRSCNLFGSDIPFITWQERGQIYGQPLHGKKINIGEGIAVSVVQLNHYGLIAAWEKGGKIVRRRI